MTFLFAFDSEFSNWSALEPPWELLNNTEVCPSPGPGVD